MDMHNGPHRTGLTDDPTRPLLRKSSRFPITDVRKCTSASDGKKTLLFGHSHHLRRQTSISVKTHQNHRRTLLLSSALSSSTKSIATASKISDKIHGSQHHIPLTPHAAIHGKHWPSSMATISLLKQTNIWSPPTGLWPTPIVEIRPHNQRCQICKSRSSISKKGIPIADASENPYPRLDDRTGPALHASQPSISKT
ncbi:hypothetical protein ACLOJK_005619 [Asimina triloba]